MSSKNNEIYLYLRSINCCNICCLRFLNGRGDEYFQVNETLKLRGIDDIDKNDVYTVCVACMDILKTKNIDKVVEKVTELLEKKIYDCDLILTSIQLPIILNLRQLSIWFELLNKFKTNFSEDVPPDIPLKEVYKTILNPKICEVTGKTFDQNGVMINIPFTYKDEEQQLMKLSFVKPELFDQRPRKYKKPFITRNSFERNFTPKNLPMNLFLENIPFPPENNNTNDIELEPITLTGPTIFLAGRYRKTSRNLSQTPWILEGKRVMEDSVQEIIVDSIFTYFGIPKETYIFSSSGREDVDVRCLGDGRSFVLEIQDSHKVHLPEDIAIKMESDISKSNKVFVKDLQLVKREELVHIKMGEEKKRKSYRALCTIKEIVTLDILQKLEMPEGFLTHQITPLRVLHRRPLLERPRNIFSVRPYINKDNLNMIYLDVVTQAGTYIKELVHGDFGRTNPSITSILGIKMDIVKLDVMSIDLDWPKTLDRNILITPEL